MADPVNGIGGFEPYGIIMADPVNGIGGFEPYDKSKVSYGLIRRGNEKGQESYGSQVAALTPEQKISLFFNQAQT